MESAFEILQLLENYKKDNCLLLLMNFDYRIIIDLSVISSPYNSRLEATKHLDGTWKLAVIYKTKNESDITANLNLTHLEIIDQLKTKINNNNQRIEKLKDNLEFLIEQLKK